MRFFQLSIFQIFFTVILFARIGIHRVFHGLFLIRCAGFVCHHLVHKLIDFGLDFPRHLIDFVFQLFHRLHKLHEGIFHQHHRPVVALVHRIRQPGDDFLQQLLRFARILIQRAAEFLQILHQIAVRQAAQDFNRLLNHPRISLLQRFDNRFTGLFGRIPQPRYKTNHHQHASGPVPEIQLVFGAGIPAPAAQVIQIHRLTDHRHKPQRHLTKQQNCRVVMRQTRHFTRQTAVNLVHRLAQIHRAVVNLFD
ncbi:hypothetical protein VIAE108258_22435 [Vibrio aerogenes]